MNTYGLTLLLLLTFVTACSARNTHEFPAGGDELRAILGEAFAPYIVEGCTHTTSGTTSAPIATCRGYTADPGPPRQWLYFAETAERTITYNTGDGIYWLIAHATLTEVVAGWTRVSGTHYLWQLSATRPTIPEDAVLLQQSTVAAGAITVVVSEAPRWISPQTVTADTTTGGAAPWTWAGRGAVVTVAATKTLTLGACPQAGRYQIFAADGVSTGVVRFSQGACGEVFPEWWGNAATTFQQASDALTAAGGEISLAQGTYTQNAILAKSKVRIRGKGVGATKVVLANAQHTALYGGVGSSAAITDDMIFDCGLSDMEIDGNASNNSSGASGQGGIGPRGWTRCIFKNLYIHNTYGDSIGSFIRTRDCLFENIYMETSGRSCFAITGGSLRNTFRNNTCIAPFNTCWDMEPADNVSVLYDAHYSFNVVDGLNCVAPIESGVTSSFGPDVAAGFTGTRENNRFSNISVKQPGRYGILLTDLNSTAINNVTVLQAAFLDPTGDGIRIGGYSTLGVTNIALTGCTVRSTGGTGIGLYLSDGDAPGVTSHVSVSGCLVSNSTVADLRVDAVQHVNLSAVEARTISIAGAAQPINITSMGQGEAVASAGILNPLGLHNSYLVTGTTQINEVQKINLWLGRLLILTFDSQIVIAHNNESTEVPFYLANENNVTFCAGDTLTVRHTDVTSGENRLQEVSRSRADNEVTVTTGATPSVACARNMRLEYAAAESITDFVNGESGVDYTFSCLNTNATIVDTANGGNFQLNNVVPGNFVCSSSDILVFKKPFGLNMWHEISRSLN